MCVPVCSDVPIKELSAVLSGSPSLKYTSVSNPAECTRQFFILCPCIPKPTVLSSQTLSLGNCVLASLPQSLSVFLFDVFFHSARAYTTMPYLEGMHKRIMRSLRNAFVKWIISDWQGFCQIVDTTNISFKY